METTDEDPRVDTSTGQGDSTAHTALRGQRGDVLPWGLLYAGLLRGGALSPPAGATRGSVLTAGRFGPWRSGLLRRQSRSVLFTFKGVI